MSEKPDRPDNQDGAANPLVNRLDEAEKRIQQLEERFLKSLESAVKAHEAVAAHARWVNTVVIGVLSLFLTFLVVSAGFSVWSLFQRVEERAAEMSDKLQGNILSQTKTLREHVENDLENFKTTWGKRIEKLESEVARLQKGR